MTPPTPPSAPTGGRAPEPGADTGHRPFPPAVEAGTLVHRFLAQAAEHPDREAVVTPQVRWTYRDTARRAARVAAALEEAGGRPRRVLGIDASATLDKTRAQVARIARNTAELIELGRDLRDDEITVLEGWAGDYYGIPVASTLDAIRLTGSLEGVILDPVYEGKSMAGLIDLVRSGEIGPDSTVLYAHLGGQLALNAYSALFRT